MRILSHSLRHFTSPDPRNLPRWTHAFRRADEESAALATLNGNVDIGLSTQADEDSGTVDWELRFPDGSTGVAQSRVTQSPRGSSIYSFVLHAPPLLLGGALVTPHSSRTDLARDCRWRIWAASMSIRPAQR